MAVPNYSQNYGADGYFIKYLLRLGWSSLNAANSIDCPFFDSWQIKYCDHYLPQFVSASAISNFLDRSVKHVNTDPTLGFIIRSIEVGLWRGSLGRSLHHYWNGSQPNISWILLNRLDSFTYPYSDLHPTYCMYPVDDRLYPSGKCMTQFYDLHTNLSLQGTIKLWW